MESHTHTQIERDTHTHINLIIGPENLSPRNVLQTLIHGPICLKARMITYYLSALELLKGGVH